MGAEARRRFSHQNTKQAIAEALGVPVDSEIVDRVFKLGYNQGVKDMYRDVPIAVEELMDTLWDKLTDKAPFYVA